MKKLFSVNNILWVIYIGLLAVLLPHTAWAFAQFEPEGSKIGLYTAWAAAFAFEAAIAALTHKLSKHIEATARIRKPFAKFTKRYLSSYAFALYAALGVSSMANLAHAVEFGSTMAIFDAWGVGFGTYAIAFGAILPLVSLMFASVLSNVSDSEDEQDQALVDAKATVAALRKDLRLANEALDLSEKKFSDLGGRFTNLISDQKRDRVLAARSLWPDLNGAALAIISDSTAGYVSEVLKSVKQ